jgi:hypothetical protein
MRTGVALVVTTLLASTALVGTREWRPAFSFPAGVDENTHPRLAIARDTLVLAVSDTTTIGLFDARTGATRGSITCALLTEEDVYDPFCGWALAASSKVIAATRTDAIDVYRYDGTLVRRLPIRADAIALRGTRLLAGQVDASTGAVGAVVVDTDSGRVVQRVVAEPVPASPDERATVAFAGSDTVVAAGGHVSLFDGRTGRLRWTRTAPSGLPGFGGPLASIGSDVIVGPGVFRLDGRTGEIRAQYAISPGSLIAASGDTVAASGVIPHSTDDFGSAIHLFDARSGRFLGSLPVDPPDTEGLEAIALRGPYVSVASGSEHGDGHLWAFAR